MYFSGRHIRYLVTNDSVKTVLYASRQEQLPDHAFKHGTSFATLYGQCEESTKEQHCVKRKEEVQARANKCAFSTMLIAALSHAKGKLTPIWRVRNRM